MTQKMTMVTNELTSELLSAKQAPCLSLYQPTHRRHPENKQDPIRFRNLVRDLETLLLQKHQPTEVELLLKPFVALGHDMGFWDHTLDGLAVFGGPDFFRVIGLQQPVAELVVVSDSFHTNPLRRYLQSIARYQVLGLTLDRIQLFEGNRDSLDEIELAPGVPRTIDEALGAELTKPHETVSSYGGVGVDSMAMHHGQGAKRDEADQDAEKFFRAVDRAVLEHHSRPSGLPLVLAALPQHQSEFRQLSHNPLLMPEGLTTNPNALLLDELRGRTWQVVEPQYQLRLVKLADDFAVAKSHGLGSDEVAKVAHAAAGGRVVTLLLEADRQIKGELADETGDIQYGDPAKAHAGNLLDDLSALVEKMGGQVYIVPSEQMPTKTGVAATYRY